MAATHTTDEIRRYLNADSLGYLSQEGMVKATGLPADSFCMACYDQRYPVPYDANLDKQIMEHRRQNIGTFSEDVDRAMRQPRLL